MLDLETHLLSRRLDKNRYSSIIISDSAIYFLLFNLSGQIVGYQKYFPNGVKSRRNDPNLGKYYTLLGEEGNIKKIGVWGLESLEYRNDLLFITEGIFDCCTLHNFNLPAIAVLSNDPKFLKNWLYIISKQRRIIVVYDNDEAGMCLKKFGDESISMKTKDLGDSSDEEIAEVLKRWI